MDANTPRIVIATSLAAIFLHAGTAFASDFGASKTRAEVIAELKQARAEDRYIVGGEEYPGQNLAGQRYTQTAQAIPQAGVWLTQSGNLEVEIAPCGQALCGTVVRAIANKAMSAGNGSSQATDTRPAQGMTILREFKPANGHEWKGSIYNRQSGESYDCLMTLPAPDQLQLRIYKGDPQAGQTQVWTRIAASAGKGTAQVVSKAAP